VSFQNYFTVEDASSEKPDAGKSDENLPNDPKNGMKGYFATVYSYFS
jgi:hypothetical protein